MGSDSGPIPTFGAKSVNARGRFHPCGATGMKFGAYGHRSGLRRPRAGSPNGTLFELAGRTRAAPSTSTAGWWFEGIDDLYVRVPAKSGVAAVDPADPGLPHQGDHVRVGDVIS